MTVVDDFMSRVFDPAPWRTRAACRGMGPSLFYLDKGQNTEPTKKVCKSCPVRLECDEAGRFEYYGIWGGKSAKGRRPVRIEQVAS